MADGYDPGSKTSIQSEVPQVEVQLVSGEVRYSDSLLQAQISKCEDDVVNTDTNDGFDEVTVGKVSTTDHHFASVDFLSPWFPNVNPRKPTWKSRKSRRKVIIWTSLISMFLVFSLNLSCTVVVYTRYPLSADGDATLYEGDCLFAKRLDAGLHVIINVLSTILLGTSNLSLQLMVSPTRSEVNAAHQNGGWLDIGVPSIRNLLRLPRSTFIVAVILATSSLPIHFLYNASVFSTVSTNSYLYATITEAFLQPRAANLTFVLDNGTAVPAPTNIKGALFNVNGDLMSPYGVWREPTPESRATVEAIYHDVQVNLQNYQKLSNYKCITHYADPYHFRSNVLLISTDYESALEYNTSLLAWNTEYPDGRDTALIDPPVWSRDRANFHQGIPTLNESIMEDWRTRGFRIQYCLQVPNNVAATKFNTCRVQCAPLVLLVTSVLNLCKCFGVMWLLYGRRQHTLSTLGDAIASFLEHPDAATENIGISTSKSVQNICRRESKDLKSGPQIWEPRDIKWYYAGSKRRWYLTMLMSIMVLLTGVLVSVRGLVVIKQYYGTTAWSALWGLGFGSTSYKELMDWRQPKTGKLGLFVNIIITNIWQVLVSFVYIAQNALLSCQLVADEWTGFARERKTLRVSHPVGVQRSTYFISMPLRYGLPIMSLFGLEHWLLSQTTFIVRVIKFDLTTTPFSQVPGYTTAGYSISPAIFAVALGTLILIAQLANAFLR